MNEFAATQAILADPCRELEVRLEQLRNIRSFMATKGFSAETLGQCLAIACQITKVKQEMEELKKKSDQT